MNKRLNGSHEMNVGFVQSRCFISQQASRHLDPCFPQMSKATAGNSWVWIFDRRDDALDSCLDQRIGARGCAAIMRVRFERNVSRPSLCAHSGLVQGNRLGVLHLIENIETFTRDLSASVDDHSADEGAGANLSDTARSEFKRALHHFAIYVNSLFQAVTQFVQRA